MDKDKNLEEIKEILLSSPLIVDVLKLMESLNLPDCWLTGGAIRCTVWNKIHEYELTRNIKDIDILYYSKEPIVINTQEMFIRDIPLEFENQANIHNWYNEFYGLNLSQLNSVEDGLKFWSDSCSSLLIRLNNGELEVISLMGLDDILSGIIRPATERYAYGLTSRDYTSRLEKWKVSEKYPKLKILYE